ncbi:MotA/TolQ/ExbB proton channel family protein [Tenacibaculum agarivorans]|uniref:MotA/TolQ/ExbB proton channel family protein n=1 Tax=Tenacibaculum agarivorans TaxID=1908389 RepID=UPI00094BB77D|nr:MotA/TolQ/ExbB proton channel family protein [Tenacibaculum agarivorans]
MNFLFLGQLFDRLNEGGPIFTYPLFLMFLTCIGLTIYSFMKGDVSGKLKQIIHHVSLFALVWGFLGQMLGLIGAFDAISAHGPVSPEILAGGLKVALLSPVFGMVVFLIGRLGILSLTFKK